MTAHCPACHQPLPAEPLPLADIQTITEKICFYQAAVTTVIPGEVNPSLRNARQLADALRRATADPVDINARDWLAGLAQTYRDAIPARIPA